MTEKLIEQMFNKKGHTNRYDLNCRQFQPRFADVSAASSDHHAFALHALAGQLAGSANGFRLFAGAFFRGLFVMVTKLHFPENAFTLHFLFKRLERLVDIVIADKYLHE